MKKNTKKILLGVLAILLILILTMTIYDYKIMMPSMFKNEISDNIKNDSFKIEKSMKIDNVYVLFYQYVENDTQEFGIAYGNTELGAFCNLSNFTFGSFPNGVGSHIIDTNKGKYILIFGEKPDNTFIINYEVQDFSYNNSLTDKQFFMTYNKVPEATDENAVAINISF